MKEKFISIGNILSKESTTLANVWRIVTLRKNWKEIVGTELADHSLPLSLKGGRLLILVSDPVCNTQLQFIKHKIINDCERLLCGDYVKEIYFRIREFKKNKWRQK